MNNCGYEVEQNDGNNSNVMMNMKFIKLISMNSPHILVWHFVYGSHIYCSKTSIFPTKTEISERRTVKGTGIKNILKHEGGGLNFVKREGVNY